MPKPPSASTAADDPYPSDEMICWPVSVRVGNVKNNDSSLIEPVAAA
jgi:putative SOS response-associated peptidase YedK